MWSVGGLDQDRGSGVDIGGCGEGRELGTVEAGHLQRGLSGQMRRAHRLPVRDGGVELGGLVDGVAVVDAVGHADGERHDLCDELIDLRGGFAGVEQHEQRRIVGRGDRA